MVPTMTAAEWYGAIAGGLFLLSAVVLHRLEWPGDLKGRLAAAAGIAVAWPITLPMMSFGSVALARLLKERPGPRRKREADHVVSAA